MINNDIIGVGAIINRFRTTVIDPILRTGAHSGTPVNNTTNPPRVSANGVQIIPPEHLGTIGAINMSLSVNHVPSASQLINECNRIGRILTRVGTWSWSEFIYEGPLTNPNTLPRSTGRNRNGLAILNEARATNVSVSHAGIANGQTISASSIISLFTSTLSSSQRNPSVAVVDFICHNSCHNSCHSDCNCHTPPRCHMNCS